MLTHHSKACTHAHSTSDAEPRCEPLQHASLSLSLPLSLQVEMFVLCTPEQSDALHQELIAIETELYSELGLHFKVSRGQPPRDWFA